MKKALCAWFVVLLLACCRQQPPASLPEGQAVYFWRTELRLDSTERQFLENYHINKVYCRYFDVVMDNDNGNDNGNVNANLNGNGNENGASSVSGGLPAGFPHPNATLAFADTLPQGIALVPTVYITENCMHQQHDSLAARVVRRVVQMNATNHIGGVSELQIDCDYTARSRAVYYAFLEEVRRLAREQGMTLSTTIRLHQLQMPAPPADYGVLMLYNTGAPSNYRQRNPILDERDVQPYVRYLSDYPLPLAAAYPVYRWIRQVEGVRIEHTVDADVILHVKQMVESQRESLKDNIIVYHLDEENINRYTPQTYEAIFHH
jgi:hypothetical protein